MATNTTIKRDTYIVDAQGKVLGRMAADIAQHLMGKHKPDYQPSVDAGDNVEVKNIAKFAVTGDKMEQKTYYRHTNYPGGIRQQSMREVFEKDPAEVLLKAVSRMLPKNKQRTERLKRLTIA